MTALARLARLIPFKKKRMTMNAFIESQFGYCPLLLMFCSRTLNNKINHIHERALRLVYLDYTSSFADLLKQDEAVTIHQHNIQLLAIEMFKVIKGIGPEIMKSLFEIDHADRSRESFFTPNVNSELYGKSSVRYFGAVVWDIMLPDKLKLINDLEEFKTEIKKWTPDNCTCRLCREYVPGLGFVTTFE